MVTERQRRIAVWLMKECGGTSQRENGKTITVPISDKHRFVVAPLVTRRESLLLFEGGGREWHRVQSWPNSQLVEETGRVH